MRCRGPHLASRVVIGEHSGNGAAQKREKNQTANKQTTTSTSTATLKTTSVIIRVESENIDANERIVIIFSFISNWDKKACSLRFIH